MLDRRDLVEREIERHERSIMNLEMELDRLDQVGEDPFEDGAIIAFEKKFPGSSTVYHYAAIRSNGQWCTAGPKSPKWYPWGELVSFIGPNTIRHAV